MHKVRLYFSVKCNVCLYRSLNFSITEKPEFPLANVAKKLIRVGLMKGKDVETLLLNEFYLWALASKNHFISPPSELPCNHKWMAQM